MDVLHWVLVGFLLAFFGAAAVGNCVMLAQSYFQKRFHSPIRLIGGVAGTIACLIAPSQWLQHYWWIPPIADIGCVPLMSLTVIWLIYTKFIASSRNEK
jgi:hypothetical protein